MDLCDLTHDQKLALLALTEAVSISDGTVSEPEGRSIDNIATALGDEQFRSLMNEVDSRFASVDSLKPFLEAIKDRGARELIYGTVMAEVISGMTIDSGPSNLLQWLAGTWDIETADHQPGRA